MAELVLTDVENAVFHQLQLRATRHQRTPAEEAKAILSETLHCTASGPWAPVDAVYHRLAASGRTFSDTADLLREDRAR